MSDVPRDAEKRDEGDFSADHDNEIITRFRFSSPVSLSLSFSTMVPLSVSLRTSLACECAMSLLYVPYSLSPLQFRRRTVRYRNHGTSVTRYFLERSLQKTSPGSSLWFFPFLPLSLSFLPSVPEPNSAPLSDHRDPIESKPS